MSFYKSIAIVWRGDRKSMNDIIDSNEFYVAFLDILGFKTLLSESENRKNGYKHILDIFTNICYRKLSSAISFDDETKNIPLKDVKKYVMSDSIILYIEANKNNSLLALLKQCQLMSVSLIEQEPPILLRGAISKGVLVYGSINGYKIVFGDALVSAYLLEEESARYPRIIMLKKLLSECESRNFLKDEIKKSFYEDNDKFYVVKYLNLINDGDKRKLEKYVQEKLDSLYSPHIREKYIYIQQQLEKEI